MNYKIQYNPAINGQDLDRLIIEGRLNILEMEAIVEELAPRFRTISRALQLQVRNVEQLDLSFLQLLLAIRNRYEQLEQSISIEMELSPEWEKLLIVSGFGNFVNDNSLK